MVSLLTVGSDILPLSLCLDTALATQHSLQAGWELSLAESRLCLVINFPTACIFGSAFGNAETQLCSKGSRSLESAACSRPERAAFTAVLEAPALDSRISWLALGLPGSTAEEGGISPKEQEPESSTEKCEIKSNTL